MAIDRKLKRRLNALIERFTPDIRDAFLASVVDVTDTAALNAIVEAIAAGDLVKAFRATGMSPAAMRPLTRMIETAFETGGVTVARTFPVQMADAGASIIHFDVRNARAEAWLRDHSSQLVTRITAETQQNIQTIVEAGMRAGRNPRNIALDIVGRVDETGKRSGGIIGLTGPQTKWVGNAREELSGVPPDEHYFTRVQRDRRFDSTVRKAINEGRGLTPNEVNTLTRRYSDNLLQLRGETIARTEAMTALAKSQDEAIRQAIDNGTLNTKYVEKVWDATGDARTRPSHMHLDGQRVGMNEAFTTENGDKLMYPLDTSLGAPGSETINCRCRVDYDVDWLGEVVDDPDIDWSEWGDPTPPVPPETIEARNARLDEEQKNYVLERGQSAGVEFLSGFDAETGDLIGRNSGEKSFVQFSPELLSAIGNSDRKIVLHHNHPGSSSFSGQDLFMLNEYRGMSEIWAHGHNGSSYHAKLGSKLLPSTKKGNLDFRKEYEAISNGMNGKITDYLVNKYRADFRNNIPQDDLNLIYWHIVSLVMDRKGFISYRANLSGPSLDAATRQSEMIATILESY